MLAGLSGRDLAQATGVSQSTISRAERGHAVLSLPEVTAWADATGITGDRRAVLLALAEAAAGVVATFRTGLTSGLAALQDSVGDLEANARVVRNFQPGIIPGLLQTARVRTPDPGPRRHRPPRRPRRRRGRPAGPPISPPRSGQSHQRWNAYAEITP
jgi:transcriptional regulator with XRE-family HTH domain